ncbi:MAG: cytochrome c [Actinomycetia bacterium]|nr:cytochrome c [Actinomycetes bacterium]
MLRRLGPFAAFITLVALACAPGGGTPEALRTGRSVYGDNCSSCHGNAGQGGVGPSLKNVLSTWPLCADQKEWITLGSEGWKEVHGPTYGANNAEIKTKMPAHADKLSPDEIAAVAAFERVQYGGGDAETELAACGVADD